MGEDGIINIFLKAQADVDSRTLMGATPLIEASTKHVKVVEKLLRAGADVNAEMVDGGTALWMAINGGIVEIVGNVIRGWGKCVGGAWVMQKAVEAEWYEIVKILLVAGAVLPPKL
jgi:hypothetical protein